MNLAFCQDSVKNFLRGSNVGKRYFGLTSESTSIYSFQAFFWRIENLEKVIPKTVDLCESETQLNNLQVTDLYTGSENVSPFKMTIYPQD